MTSFSKHWSTLLGPRRFVILRGSDRRPDENCPPAWGSGSARKLEPHPTHLFLLSAPVEVGPSDEEAQPLEAQA